jgi:hypothetical protein
MQFGYIIIVIILILSFNHILNYESMYNIKNNTVKYNYSLKNNKLNHSKNFEIKYLHENLNYITSFDSSINIPNIDPIYRENKIISNTLFLTNNNIPVIPLFLTLNDYNIIKGNNYKFIVDTLL